jgi:hypothetical protein
MADVARRHGIEVVVSSLEDWDVVECDVMYAAQAWHWIDPVRGAEVAAAAIRPGGRWLAFWNDEVDEEFGRARNGVYRRLAPELVDRSSSANDDDFRSAIAGALERTGAFGAMAVGDVAWTDRLPVAVAVQRLASHSSHRLLDPEVSYEIDEALRAELGTPTDLIDLSYVTRMFTAPRR